MIYLRENLKYIRKQMGMTQEQFAVVTGLSRSRIGAYEEGRANPGIKRIAEFSKSLNISIDVLVLTDIESLHGTAMQLKVDMLQAKTLVA